MCPNYIKKKLGTEEPVSCSLIQTSTDEVINMGGSNAKFVF